ncbi:MAG: hypothetical protein HQ515_09485 [Phycisphaeraceae bacterium]|nr:hypothetical protein [Phycisphaeraceae bacterium]
MINCPSCKEEMSATHGEYLVCESCKVYSHRETPKDFKFGDPPPVPEPEPTLEPEPEPDSGSNPSETHVTPVPEPDPKPVREIRVFGDI